MEKADNVHWHQSTVSYEERCCCKGQRGVVVWLTGLSGSGKSTVANEVDKMLTLAGRHSYVLDGDNLRCGLNSDLGFSATDRRENVRRVGEVCRLFADAGLIVLVPLISPYREDRDSVRQKLAHSVFIEVYMSTPLSCCEERDPKQLYAKARAGEIKGFTGIDAPYEPPLTPELIVDASTVDVDAAAQIVFDHLTTSKVIRAST